MPHFECGAFNHSATSPGAKTGGFPPPRSGRVLGEDGGPGKARLARIPGAGQKERERHDGALDRQCQWRRVPRCAHRRRAAVAAAAWLARILAHLLVGATRESCRTYIGYFLKQWAHRKDAFDDVIEAFTDNFQKPGNLAGGFAHYRAAHEGRVRMMKGEAPQLAPIDVPTCVRWAEHDPLFPFSWTDRLGATFSRLDLALFPGVGHFPHREDPDRAAAEIAAFFKHIGWS